MRPFTLTVAKGTVSVPSPLKSMPSKTAIGWAAPSTMLNPCGLNTYEPRSVCRPQSARAVPEIAIIMAKPSRLASEVAEVRVLIILCITLFIFWFSFAFGWFGPLWLLVVRSYVWPFIDVLQKMGREVTRKIGFAVEALKPRRRGAKDPPTPRLRRDRLPGYHGQGQTRKERTADSEQKITPKAFASGRRNKDYVLPKLKPYLRCLLLKPVLGRLRLTYPCHRCNRVALLLWREGGNNFFEAWVAAQRVP